MADLIPTQPAMSFRAMEKLGMENPFIEEALKKSNVFALGYDPNRLIQNLLNEDTGRGFNITKSNFAGSYLPENYKERNFKGRDIVNAEGERRGFEKGGYAYVNPLDKNMFLRPERLFTEQGSKDPVGNAAKMNDMSKEDYIKLRDYMQSNEYLYGTMFEEFFHRGVMDKLNKDYSNQYQDNILSILRYNEAPKEIKPLMKKYIENTEGLKSDKLGLLGDKLESLESQAKRMIDEKNKDYVTGKNVFDSLKDKLFKFTTGLLGD
jgi:hypothetical protein